MKLKILILILLLGFNWPLMANDPFFIQYYNAQLNVNPALTGISYGNIRLGINYRNYLSSIDAFETYAFSADMSMLETKLGNDFMGVGILVAQDQSGHEFKRLNGRLSLSYHKSINQQASQFVSFGFQGGVIQSTNNFSGLSTQSQWDPTLGFDPLLSNGESFTDENLLNVDLRAGLMWYGFFHKSTLFFGGSVNHLTRPATNFTTTSFSQPINFLLHGGGTFNLTDKFNLNPSIIWNNNNGLNHLITGAQVEYDISRQQDKFVSFGIWSRNTDALTASGGFEFSNLYICLSYDIMISELQQVTVNDGFEISLIYQLGKKLKSIPGLKSDPNLHL